MIFFTSLAYESRAQETELKKDKPSMSEKGLAATEIILAVIGNGLKEPRKYLAQFAERDLIDWAFPESVVRTRQIWRSWNPTRSMSKTIETVDAERTSTLNVRDMSAWKSSMAGPEMFYIKDSRGLLFTVRIESPTGVLGQRNRERFLSIDEAIRRYFREGGHLVNAALPKPEAVLSETEMMNQSI
jgi:hypothetical protein